MHNVSWLHSKDPVPCTSKKLDHLINVNMCHDFLSDTGASACKRHQSLSMRNPINMKQRAGQYYLKLSHQNGKFNLEKIIHLLSMIQGVLCGPCQTPPEPASKLCVKVDRVCCSLVEFLVVHRGY